MTLRTTSIVRQRQAWACLALLGVGAYFVLVYALDLGNPFHFFGSHQMRVLLPLVVFLRIFAREFRWDGVKREVKTENKQQGNTVPAVTSPVSEVHSSSDLPREVSTASVDTDERVPLAGQPEEVLCPPPPPPHISTLPTQPAVESASGEDLFEQARALPHQLVPDFEADGQYLELLGESAAQGYAPALAKLGEYAMRRAAWVEAYYWMSMAKRQGMQGLANVMREIRKNWLLDGFPDEAENVNQLFTSEFGSIGRAFLHIDSGREVATAKEFLMINYPELVT